jgi:hypothetical protein
VPSCTCNSAHQLAINAPIPTQEVCTSLWYSTMLFHAVTNSDPACVQRATECLCHLWNVPNRCPHQKTNDLAVQGFHVGKNLNSLQQLDAAWDLETGCN